MTDIVTVAGIIRFPNLMEVNPSFPAKTVPEFISYAKANPRKVTFKPNNEINAALADPKVGARLADLGGTLSPGSPAEFGKLVADDKEKWAKVIRGANIKPE